MSPLYPLLYIGREPIWVGIPTLIMNDTPPTLPLTFSSVPPNISDQSDQIKLLVIILRLWQGHMYVEITYTTLALMQSIDKDSFLNECNAAARLESN